MRQKRRSAIGFIFLLLLSSLILGAAWLYTTWRSSQAVLPPGLSINGVPMGGMTSDQALTAIELAYTVPVSVTYAGTPIPPLLPEVIELRLDAAATSENLQEAVTADTSIEAFLRYVASQVNPEAQEQIEVSAVVLYSRDRVNAYLERIAQKYDHVPMEPVLLPEAGTFRPAVEGTQLNVEASVPLLIEAILAADPADRQVTLVVETEPSPDPSTTVLQQALDATLAPYPGVIGIFAKDLESGQELCVNCDIAFSGFEPGKLAIALEAYRVSDAPLDGEQARQLQTMLTEGETASTGNAAGAAASVAATPTANATADAVLAELGASNPYSGAQQVNELLWSLGLQNTYILGPAVPVAGEASPDGLTTSANSRADLATDPDPLAQTTAMEMGILLEGVYHCSNGGGCLRALYPQKLTPLECQNLLAMAAQPAVAAPLGQALPAGAKVAHQQGAQGSTFSDIALIYGSQTDFVLATFVYQPESSTWADVLPIFSDVGRLSYLFFEGAPQTSIQ